MIPPRTRLVLALVVLVGAAVALCGPSEARGQDVGAPPAAPDWAARVSVESRPRAPLAGVAIAFPVGNEADPAGSEGALQVAADAVVQTVEAQVGREAARGEAEVRGGRTVFAFAVRPERVGDLLAAFEGAALGAGPAPGSVARVRDARVEQLGFERDSPLADVRQAERALLHGDSSSRARPPEGTLGSVASLDGARVDAVRRAAWRAGEAAVALVGPFAQIDAGTEVLPMEIGPEALPVAVSPEAPADTVGEFGGPTWSIGERRPIRREVTNAWITVAWPVDRATPHGVAEFLAHRMRVALNPLPPDPGVFEADAAVEVLEGGRVIVVRAAVLPERTDAIETIILGLPGRLAAPYDDAFLAADLRRYRSERMLDAAAPERAARLEVLRALVGASAELPAIGGGALSPALVPAAASALGPARILVVAPFLQ